MGEEKGNNCVVKNKNVFGKLVFDKNGRMSFWKISLALAFVLVLVLAVDVLGNDGKVVIGGEEDIKINLDNLTNLKDIKESSENFGEEYLCNSGRDYDIYCFDGYPNKKLAKISNKPKNFYNGTDWEKIDLDIKEINNSYYGGLKNNYQVYFNKNFSSSYPIKYIYKNFSISFQPQEIGYFDFGQKSVLRYSYDSFEFVTKNNFNYLDAFGEDIDLSYDYNMDTLKEKLILNNKSFLNFSKKYFLFKQKIEFSEGLTILIDNSDFKIGEEINTSSDILFLKNEEIIFYIPPAEAWDFNDDLIIFNRSLVYNSDATLTIESYVPMDWLVSAIAPIIIDDTVTVGDVDSAIPLDGFIYKEINWCTSSTSYTCYNTDSNLSITSYYKSCDSYDVVDHYMDSYIGFNVSSINSSDLFSINYVNLSLNVDSVSGTPGNLFFTNLSILTNPPTCDASLFNDINDYGYYLENLNIPTQGVYNNELYSSASTDLYNSLLSGQSDSFFIGIFSSSLGSEWQINISSQESLNNPELIISYTTKADKTIEVINSSYDLGIFYDGWLRQVFCQGNNLDGVTGENENSSFLFAGYGNGDYFGSYDRTFLSYIEFNLSDLPDNANISSILFGVKANSTQIDNSFYDEINLYSVNTSNTNSLKDMFEFSDNCRSIYYNTSFQNNYTYGSTNLNDVSENFVNVSLNDLAVSDFSNSLSDDVFSFALIMYNDTNDSVGNGRPILDIKDYFYSQDSNFKPQLFVAYTLIDSCSPPGSGDWTCSSSCSFVDESLSVAGNLYVQNGCTLELNGTTNVAFSGANRYVYIYSGGEIWLRGTAGFNK